MEKKKDGIYDDVLGIWIDADGTSRIPMNGFPQILFLDWNRHCVMRHKNCRWEKAYSDHEKARAYEILMAQIAEGNIPSVVEQEQTTVEKQEENKNSIKLFR